jgi:hypothetical protein
MQRIVPSLLIAARVLAILAVLALLFTLWMEGIGVGFTCFDTCYTPAQYFTNKAPSAFFSPTPTIVLAALALVVFLVFCLATRQPWRALIVLLHFLVGGLLGIVVLNILVQYGRATVPVDPEGGLLIEHPVMDWARQWAQTIVLLGVVWSGGLACLEWGCRWRRVVSALPSSR